MHDNAKVTCLAAEYDVSKQSSPHEQRGSTHTYIHTIYTLHAHIHADIQIHMHTQWWMDVVRCIYLILVFIVFIVLLFYMLFFRIYFLSLASFHLISFS